MEQQDVGLVFLRTGANLFYLTGVPHRDTYRTDHNAYGDWVAGAYIGDEEIVLVSPRMGGQYFVDQTLEKPWFDEVRLLDESEEPMQVMRDILDRFALNGRQVVLEDHAWAESMMAFKSLLPDIPVATASDLIAPMRMIKSDTEIELMRRSGEICDAAFRKALARLKLGVTPWDVEAEINYQLRCMGGWFNSFPTNVMFTNPDKDPSLSLGKTERRLQPRDAVVFDLGCIFEGYASDFGRTAFAGEPPRSYRRMHELVLAAQGQAMEVMRAGQVTAAEVDAVARGVMEEGGYGEAFSHRLGHGIGVTVHEPPFLDVMDETVLQENMTFTVEPSIRVPNGYHNRVEDVVLVTDEGGISLYQTDHRLYRVG
jgi:Xaa-Pro aminopeptidase